MSARNLNQFERFARVRSSWRFERPSATSRRHLLGHLVSLAVLCAAPATPAWAGPAVAAPPSLLWYIDSAARPAVSSGDSAEVSEQPTLDEAIAVALDANRLVKNQERLQFIRESVKQAYEGAQRAQRALEVREEALKTSRELDRLMAEPADRGEPAPSVVLEARATLASATNDVLSARQELVTWIGHLNHLMGRDPQARLRVSPEAEPTSGLASRERLTASGK